MTARFIGRSREFAELARLHRAAAAGSGALLLLCGEPGIGKTTLLSQLSRHAADAGTAVLAGRCVADEGAPAFWPWQRILEQAGLPAALLDLPDGPPSAARFTAMERTARALVGAAEPDGLVITVDDLHWAHDSTRRLLDHLRGDLASSRLLVVGTTWEVTPELADLRAQVLRLGPLTELDVASYLAAAGEVDPSWPPYVHGLTGGNPLFVRELARVLVQEGRLGEPATPLPVPAELRRMAGYQIRRLEPAGRRLLEAASAIGEEFDVVLLGAVTGIGSGELAALLGDAVAKGVLTEEAEAPDRLRFTHALVRQACYDELARTERVEWHRRIADVLDAGGAARPGEVARHRVRAAADVEGRAAAVAACRSAAAEAERELDFTDAAHWYRRALELLDHVGGRGHAVLLLELAEAAYQDAQVTEALEHCVAAIDLAERLGEPELAARAALVVRGIDGAPNETIAVLCARALTLIGAEESALHAQVLAQHAQTLAETGDLDAAEALSRRALAMAERDGDPAALVDALRARQKLCPPPYGVAEQLDLGARLRGLGAVPGRPEAALWAYVWRIDACFQLGEVAGLDAEIVGLTGLVERLGWPLARWHLLRIRAARAQLAGEFAAAEELTLAAREAGWQTQDDSVHPQFFALMGEILRRTGEFARYDAGGALTQLAREVRLPIALATVGHYWLAAGERDHAAAMFRRLRPSLAALPRDSRWLVVTATAGELAAGLGDLDIAEACYRALVPHSGHYMGSASGYRGAVAGTLGIIATALGRYDDADRHLTDAEQMEHRIGAVADLALARLAHARALAARGAPGDRNRAIKLADQCIETARRHGMAPALAAATTLADELAGVSPDGASALTRREREIAAMVADGLANRAIADQLVLSERTVETHVRNLLIKLDLTNRRQVAAWADRAGLRGGSA